jgi:hypothetical protein
MRINKGTSYNYQNGRKMIIGKERSCENSFCTSYDLVLDASDDGGKPFGCLFSLR